MASSLLENLSTDSTVACKTNSSKLSPKPRRSWKEFMQRRNGARVYVCNVNSCGKAFNYLSSLVKHERIHKGERPYACKICSQSFAQSSNLKRHEKTHTGEKSFECTRCQKKFSTISNLRQHQQTHKEETLRKHYKCDQCGRNYLYPSSLSKHVRFCEGITESDEVGQDHFHEEETILKKLVKIEDKAVDESLSQNDQKTQIAESSESSSANSFPISFKKSPETTPVTTLESAIRNNSLLFNTLPIKLQQPLQQPIINYPLISHNAQPLSNLFFQKTPFNPIQSIQNGLYISPLNMMSFAQNPAELYLRQQLQRQQLQNRLIQQTNLNLALGRVPFF